MARTPLYSLTKIHRDYIVGEVPLQALREVSLAIESGESLALVGPSGSGKTTLLNILGLIETPTAGSFQFQGQELVGSTEKTRASLRRDHIGFIFQSFNLSPVLSAVENVEYALLLQRKDTASAIRLQAHEALDAVGLSRFAQHRPSQLSGGQRQRVAIARALVKKPLLILADEPTANLDSESSKQVMALVRDLHARLGTTVIVATHDQTVASTLDRRVQLKDGYIIADSSARALAAY